DAAGAAKPVNVSGPDGVLLTATDKSRITVDSQAVSVAASLTPSKGTAISVGVAVAQNTVDNNVDASIRHAHVVTSAGPVVIQAHTPEDASDFAFDYDASQGGTVALKAGDRVKSKAPDGKVYRFLGETYRFTTHSTAPVKARNGVLAGT